MPLKARLVLLGAFTCLAHKVAAEDCSSASCGVTEATVRDEEVTSFVQMATMLQPRGAHGSSSLDSSSSDDAGGSKPNPEKEVHFPDKDLAVKVKIKNVVKEVWGIKFTGEKKHGPRQKDHRQEDDCVTEKCIDCMKHAFSPIKNEEEREARGLAKGCEKFEKELAEEGWQGTVSSASSKVSGWLSSVTVGAFGSAPEPGSNAYKQECCNLCKSCRRSLDEVLEQRKEAEAKLPFRKAAGERAVDVAKALEETIKDELEPSSDETTKKVEHMIKEVTEAVQEQFTPWLEDAEAAQDEMEQGKADIDAAVKDALKKAGKAVGESGKACEPQAKLKALSPAEKKEHCESISPYKPSSREEVLMTKEQKHCCAAAGFCVSAYFINYGARTEFCEPANKAYDLQAKDQNKICDWNFAVVKILRDNGAGEDASLCANAVWNEDACEDGYFVFKQDRCTCFLEKYSEKHDFDPGCKKKKAADGFQIYELEMKM